MKIVIGLSTESISAAIERLQDVKDNLEWGLSETIDILCKEGAMMAQADYGGMATVEYERPNENSGVIITSGKANIIAEFGAGDATELPTAFENMPSTPVYPGSYSESDEGSGMYAEFGWWKFGGRIYRKIEPRHGLLNARNHIVDKAAEIAREVIKL